MTSLLRAVTLSLLIVTVGYTATFAPGQTVRLVERDLHIPAHPAPGDRSVHLRFASGTHATVLSVDAQTGWINLRGESIQGNQATGWIVARYIVTGEAGESDNGSAASGALSWCPPKGSPTPHSSGRLRIATWNLGNLHADNGQSTFTGSDPSVTRSATDYERIRCYVRLFDPDILAVQEVDGEEALARVVDADVYEVHVSDRPQGSLNGQQNTGFAYKKGLTVTPQADVEALDIAGNGRLRYGTRIDLSQNGQTVKFLSIHLKSGCFQDGSSSSACPTLQNQVPVLESWIDTAANASEPFIVLGDFNRRLTRPGDTVRAELDDGQPSNADLTVITDHMPISCRDNQFTEFIDHIVFDKRAAAWVDRTSFRHQTYRQDDKAVWNQISDHCPVVVEVWIPEA